MFPSHYHSKLIWGFCYDSICSTVYKKKKLVDNFEKLIQVRILQLNATEFEQEI